MKAIGNHKILVHCKFNAIVIAGVVVLLFFTLACKSFIGKNNTYLDNRIELSSDVHPAILYLIKNFNNLDKTNSDLVITNINQNDYLSAQMKIPNDKANRFYFVIKFFELSDSLFFTMWQQPTFPEFIKTPDSTVRVDLENMYYFEIGNVNLVFLDFPESTGHNLYKNKDEFNSAAIKKKEEFEAVNRDLDPVLTSRESTYQTFHVEREKFRRVTSIIPPKLKTEKELIIEDIDLN